MNSFLNMLNANFKQFLRDKTALFFTLAFPVLFIIMFGLVFSGTDKINYDVALVNEDDSQISQGIVQAFSQVSIFSVQDNPRDDSLQLLTDGKLKAVIILPAGLGQAALSGQTTEVQVYYDGSQTSVNQIILPVVKEILQSINREITQTPVLFEISEETIQTKDMSMMSFFIPGVLAMSIMFLGIYSAMPLIQQREKKILKRLGASPISRSTIIFSQVVLRLGLAVLQTVIIIVIGQLMFGVEILGNWWLLLGLVMLGTLSFISLGFLVASLAKTEEGAMPIVQLIQFPMMFLSGIFFPLEYMPDFMRPVVNALPLTYLGDAFRQVMVDGAPAFPLGVDLLVVTGWLVVCMVISVRFFRWE